ncbi:hypothetical protein [Flexibacterium corallicola]|uniref:hypothetical protein n=1 Tax=Flexibacterium corallicola TaxID=3037259 RepID=UPI00286EB75C|nr:hypothetical protein [Pseudovibrio sp. M1P-2-3]
MGKLKTSIWIVLLSLPFWTYPLFNASAEEKYIDNRSTPQGLIASLYNAINSKQYARAYSYHESGTIKEPYQTWLDGYKTTKHVKVILGKTQAEGAAGSIYWSLPVAIRAEHTDGATQVFAGCYVLHLTQPLMQQTPPYIPMQIKQSNLVKSSKPFEQSLPKSCPDS